MEGSKVAKEAANKLNELSNGLADVKDTTKRVSNQVRENAKIAKELKPLVEKNRKAAEAAKKTADAAGKVTDALKQGKWSKVGGAFGKFMGLALIALTIFSTILGIANTWAIENISESTINQFERNGQEFALQFNSDSKILSKN